MNAPHRALTALVFDSFTAPSALPRAAGSPAASSPAAPAPAVAVPQVVRALEAGGARALVAASWAELVRLAWLERPQVVVVAGQVDEVVAAGVLAQIRAALPDVAFVRMGAREVEIGAEEARMGFRGVCSKGAAASAVAQVVLGVAAGRRLAAHEGGVVALAVPVRELNRREREILELVCGGLGNREIGERLFLAESTVKWHLRAIGEVLGVTGRVSLAVEALRLGIVRL